MKTKSILKGSEKVLDMQKKGKGFKIVSRCLDIPLSSAGSIVRKWKLHHTSQALPKPSRLSELSIRPIRGIVKDVTERPTNTLKELQSSVTKTGVKVHQSRISGPLHTTGLSGRAARNEPLLNEKQHQSTSGVC